VIESGDKARVLAGLVRHHERFTIERFAAGHVPQLKAMRDRSPWIHVLCDRQSGKTWFDIGAITANMLERPRSKNVFLGLVGTGLRFSVWPIWKEHCERWGLCDDNAHNETLMLTKFPNGSRVIIGGTDDLKNVKKFLGNRMAGSVVVIDEAQDQVDSMLRYLLRQLLPPMLTKTSRVILSGVLPDVPSGTFLDLAERDEQSGTGGKGPGWSHHSWGRFANVHTPEARQQLADYKEHHQLTDDDPQIQRDWLGCRRVWDLKATAYKYRQDRNGYVPERPAWLDDEIADLEAAGVPYAHDTREDAEGVRCGVMAAEPPEWMTEFSVAIDPGAADRFPVEVEGWGEGSREIRQVFEYSPPRGAGLTWGKVAPVLAIIQRRYGPIHWRYDAGGSKVELDAFDADYQIPVIHAAKKVDAAGQIRRVNDLYEQGRKKVMIGSALEQDCQRARGARQPGGAWKWTGEYHPDPSEADRYATEPYIDTYKPPPSDEEKTRQEREERRARHERRVHGEQDDDPWADTSTEEVWE
jgi:hypothetical protein